MRVHSIIQDDEPTTVFWKPEPDAAPAAPALATVPEASYRNVRTYEVHTNDVPVIVAPQAYAPQTYAPQTYAPQTYAPQTYPQAAQAPNAYQTHAVARPHRVGLGVGFAGVCLLVGVLVGCVIAFGTNHASIASAAPPVAPAAAPAAAHPAVAPIVAAPAPVVAPAPAPKSNTHVIRVESDPADATVVLVDGAKSTLLGSTPLDAELDAAKSYDLVFTLANHDTKIVHFDAATDLHVAVALDTAAAPTPAAPAPVAAPMHAHHTVERHTPAPAAAPHHDAAPAVMGSLQISSKPPCTIIIDGKSTGLVTPQRSVSLTAGSHEVTLVNAAEGIHLTTSVEVAADHPTQLVQDFTK